MSLIATLALLVWGAITYPGLMVTFAILGLVFIGFHLSGWD